MGDKVQNPWEFACEWYTVEKTKAHIQERQPDGNVPTDVHGDEFAEWLTNQMRLSMARGILHGRLQQADIDKPDD